MPKKNSSNKKLKQEMITQWGRINQRLYPDIPSFSKIWNSVVEAGTRRRANHPVARLFKYIDSLRITLEQAVYSMDRLRKFSITESSNVSEFYVGHYLYDFLARVKTVTDLLALIINHVFEIGLEEKDCSLEKGKLSNTLIQTFRGKNPDNNQAMQLGLELEKARNNWLKGFYDLRNLIIHRAGLRFIGMAVPDVGPSRIHIASDNIFSVANEREILRKLLTQIGGISMSRYQTIDPVELCEELWKRLTELVELVISSSRSKIFAFIHLMTQQDFA